jgi:hypothetical protein
MRPVFEQEEKLSIGKVSLWAHSELECVNLEVRFTLTRLDIINLISYCIDNHCGFSLYSKSKEDTAKLEGVEVHRNSFPSELAEQQAYAQELIKLYHSLQGPVIILPSTLIGELVLEALKAFYSLDYDTWGYDPVYPFFGVLFQSTLMSGKVEIV